MHVINMITDILIGLMIEFMFFVRFFISIVPKLLLGTGEQKRCSKHFCSFRVLSKEMIQRFTSDDNNNNNNNDAFCGVHPDRPKSVAFCFQRSFIESELLRGSATGRSRRRSATATMMIMMMFNKRKNRASEESKIASIEEERRRMMMVALGEIIGKSLSWWANNGCECVILYTDDDDENDYGKSTSMLAMFKDLDFLEGFNKTEMKSRRVRARAVSRESGKLIEFPIITTSSSSHRHNDYLYRRQKQQECDDDGDDDDEEKEKCLSLDIVLLNKNSAYDLLVNYARDIEAKSSKKGKQEEKMKTGKTVEIKDLPSPELLVCVSKAALRVGKFPGFLLSKCELALVNNILNLKKDRLHERIMSEYLNSFQRFGQ